MADCIIVYGQEICSRDAAGMTKYIASRTGLSGLTGAIVDITGR